MIIYSLFTTPILRITYCNHKIIGIIMVTEYIDFLLLINFSLFCNLPEILLNIPKFQLKKDHPIVKFLITSVFSASYIIYKFLHI